MTKRTHNYLNSKTGEIVSGWRGGRAGRETNLFTGLLFDVSLNDRPMSFRGKSGRAKSDYLVTAYEAGKPQHSLRYDRLERGFLGFLEDLDWKAVASQSESDEAKAVSAELETVRTEIDRISRLVDKLTAMTDDVTLISPSLFAKLDEAKAQLLDAALRKERLATVVAAARSESETLYSPEALIEAIRSGDPEKRLKLKAEIRKRISRIDVDCEADFHDDGIVVYHEQDGAGRFLDMTPHQFGEDPGQVVRIVFINGVDRFIILDQDKAVLLWGKSLSSV